MIAADLNKRFDGETAVGDEFLGVGEGNHITGPTVQNHRICLERKGFAPVLPCRSQENQGSVARIQIDRHRTARSQPPRPGDVDQSRIVPRATQPRSRRHPKLD